MEGAGGAEILFGHPTSLKPNQANSSSSLTRSMNDLVLFLRLKIIFVPVLYKAIDRFWHVLSIRATAYT